MSIWQEVKEKVKLSEIIAEYLPIKAQGSNFACLCPFHQEDTPSLIISDYKGIWHCFGCGAGGNVFDFVSLYEKISKKEALIKLAKRVGLEANLNSKQTFAKRQNIEDIKSTQTTDYDRGLQLLAWSAELYHQVLVQILKKNPDHPVSQYCKKRGLDLATIELYKIGFAPDGNFLTEIVGKKGSNSDLLDLLVEVGLLKKTQN